MMKTNISIGKSSVIDLDVGTNEDQQQEEQATAETEILCHACGFSSEFVPEGMIPCHHCFMIQYCSVECRDWEWSTSHKNICQPIHNVVESSTTTATTVKSNHSQVTESGMKNDGKLGESFSDGSVSITSIDANNLFDKKQSPFLLSKSKLGRISAPMNSSIVSPKQTIVSKKQQDRSNNEQSNLLSNASNGSIQNTGSTTKRGPNTSKSLGNYVASSSPKRNVSNRIPFVMSTDDDDDSDDDNNGSNSHSEDSKSGASNSEYTEEESVGMSVLEAQSAANLTAIAEESNVMSGPIIEASWRRNIPNRLASIRTADSTLVMNDSEIIGTESLAEITAYQNDISRILQQEDDMAYGVRLNGCSESNSSMMGNHNSVVVASSVSTSGYLFNQSDQQDLVYSDASAPNLLAHQNEQSQESLTEPEIAESSNSSDSGEYPSKPMPTLGSRPTVIQRAPSLRGFRDAYNECDTASLHSRSLARSLSSSDDSLSSHVDAGDLPERLQRSSSSLRDFRDIYNSDLNTRLLSCQQSVNSLGCSSSLDEFTIEYVNVANVNSEKTEEKNILSGGNNLQTNTLKNESSLSSQLEFITMHSRSTTESEIGHQPHSPTKSDDTTTSLQMARMRNESMKKSLNNALRVYEQVYGEDAAKDIFFQLTNTAETSTTQQKPSKDEDVIVWKRPGPGTQENRQPLSNNNTSVNDAKKGNDIKAFSTASYMKYRSSLSSSNINKTSNHTEKSDFPVDVDKCTSTENQKSNALLKTSQLKGSARYIQYRDKLCKETSLSSRSARDETGLGISPLPILGSEASGEAVSDRSTIKEVNSDSNFSQSMDSSLDKAYQPLEVLESNLNLGDGNRLEPSDRTAQNQLNTRFSQYRKSMENLLLSTSLKDVSNNEDTTLAPPSSTVFALYTNMTNTSNAREVSLDEFKNEQLCNRDSDDQTNSNVLCNSNPKYLKYRQALMRADSNDSEKGNRKWRKPTKFESESRSPSWLDILSNNVNTIGNEHGHSNRITPKYQEDSMTSIIGSEKIGSENGECLHTIQSTTSNHPESKPPMNDQHDFRIAFEKRYTQYRSSLQHLFSTENDDNVVHNLPCSDHTTIEKERRESTEALTIEKGDCPTNFDNEADDKLIVEDNNIEDTSDTSDTEVANMSALNSIPQVYQLVDMDEVTVTSVSADEASKLYTSTQKSHISLADLGYHTISCAGVNLDTFLRVWTEVETDRVALSEERIRNKSDKKKVHGSGLLHMPNVAPHTQPHHLTSTTTIKKQTSSNKNVIDIETGLLSLHPNIDSIFLSNEMKRRALQYHRKKRICWCIMISALIILPLAIGLGVALTPNGSNFVNLQSSNDNSSNISPISATPSPSLAPIQVSPTITPITPMPTSNAKPLSPVQMQTLAPSIAPMATNPTPYPSLIPVAPTPPLFVPSPSTETKYTPTNAPLVTSTSPAQNVTRNREELLMLLQSVSSDGGAAILSSGSPQQQAFEWLLSDNNFLQEYSDARILQRYALVTLYYSTDGANWSDKLGWLTADNECTWHTMATINNCDSENLYLNIDLSSNDLTGVIPNELSLLPRISALKLSGGPSRFIGGIIPSILGSMSSLKVIDIQGNNLFGSIPSALGKLDQLESLDLSMNRLSNVIPSEICNLSTLKRLNLAGNELTGELPTSLDLLTGLERLSLGKNNLSGQINIGYGLSMLSELNLEENRFSSLGDDIGQLTGLETMTMYQNLLLGNIPSQIVRLSRIKRLDLHGNSLTGPIPLEIGSLSLLTNLDLSRNNLSGVIPSSIGSLTNLEKLNLQNNFLVGPLPLELGRLSTLSIIRINNNNISGSVPEQVCENFGLNPLFILDCLESSDGATELICPPGTCCTICCNDEGSCKCKYEGTTLEFLCNI